MEGSFGFIQEEVELLITDFYVGARGQKPRNFDRIVANVFQTSLSATSRRIAAKYRNGIDPGRIYNFKQALEMFLGNLYGKVSADDLNFFTKAGLENGVAILGPMLTKKFKSDTRVFEAGLKKLTENVKCWGNQDLIKLRIKNEKGILAPGLVLEPLTDAEQVMRRQMIANFDKIAGVNGLLAISDS